MNNVAIALQILTTLIGEAMQILPAIQTAQSTGTDITPETLANMATQASGALSQLATDIAAAQGKSA